MSLTPETKQIVVSLLDSGYSPTAVALHANVDVDVVLALIPEDERRLYADDIIQDGLRIVAWRSIQEAMRILDEGNLQSRLAIIRTFGAEMKQVLGVSKSGEMEEMRADMESMLEEMRDAPGTAGEAVDDQDQEPPVGEDTPELGSAGGSGGSRKGDQRE
jgi:hypothetical protein